MSVNDLLLEVGTEEIPAWFLAKAIDDLATLAKERLAAARLEHGAVKTLGTPRRLTLAVSALAERQADVSEVVTGPPAKAAFDAAGKPTKAALGFAQKMGVPVEALSVQEVPGKGAYVAARREEKGSEARAILPRLLPELIRAVPWKKSMRWAALEESFVRPVHWIAAIYGGEVVPFELYGVKSGRETRGHRFLSPDAVALGGSLDDYLKKLRAAYVLADPAARRVHIEAELQKISVRPDPELIDEVTNLVEWPVAVVGTFASEYLQIPREVIISAMRSHQRYFACEKDGALENRFVTIAGTVVADKSVVQHGNERVLAARLADARFFWQEDTKVSLDEHAKKLSGVVFQAKLGTIADKVARIGQVSWPRHPLFRRTVEICKADLVTKMVGEFPELQGVMGGYHPHTEDDEIYRAIREHYLPKNAADALPKGDLGAEVGVADRLDTIVGCFAIGLSPTGSADAYGLRRAALAVLNIVLDRQWRTPLGALVDDAARQYGAKISWTAQARAQVLEFFQTRLRGLFVDRKLPADCVDAALGAGFEDVPDAIARATAVSRLRERPDFEPLGTAFKRIGNILPERGGKAEPDEALLVEPSEKALWKAFAEVRARVDGHVREQRYDAALGELAALKPAVDKFFDDVLVMDKDPKVKANRLALLGAIDRTFMTIADFRQLAVG